MAKRSAPKRRSVVAASLKNYRVQKVEPKKGRGSYKRKTSRSSKLDYIKMDTSTGNKSEN